MAVDRILDMGLSTRPWLTQLKQAVLTGAPDTHALIWHGEMNTAITVKHVSSANCDR